MTKEQIVKLRRVASDMEMEPSHPRMNQEGEAIDHLLDEREALLEALKSAAGQLRAACEEDCTAEAILAEAAIAKAEAP